MTVRFLPRIRPSRPSPRSDQANPTNGAKLLLSLLYSFVSGWLVPGPTSCRVVNEPFANPGWNNAFRPVPEMPNMPALPPTGAAARPKPLYGTPYHSYRNPRLRVNAGVTLKSSLKYPLYSRDTMSLYRLCP